MPSGVWLSRRLTSASIPETNYKKTNLMSSNIFIIFEFSHAIVIVPVAISNDLFCDKNHDLLCYRITTNLPFFLFKERLELEMIFSV